MSADAKVSLREQADEAQRELARRHRVFAGMVRHGRMTEAEAAVGIATMRAIRDTLRLFAAHEDAIRAALVVAIRRAGEADEIAALNGHPVVGALLEAFPGAAITSITPAGADVIEPDTIEEPA